MTVASKKEQKKGDFVTRLLSHDGEGGPGGGSYDDFTDFTDFTDLLVVLGGSNPLPNL